MNGDFIEISVLGLGRTEKKAYNYVLHPSNKNVNLRSFRRVAIVHYWLVSLRGGEKVLDSLLKLFPKAEIFTLFADPELIKSRYSQHKVHVSILDRIPFARKYHKHFLPLMPFALERLDLSGFDLVLSSESGPAKGVIADPEALHISYCHSPMRYLYDMKEIFESRMNPLTRFFFQISSHYLRIWDTVASHRVDHFIANSTFIQKRIHRAWGRGSQVISPPVSVEKFKQGPDLGYYFILSQLVPYKRVDLAVDAFNRLGLPLWIAGEGSELSRLKKMAGPKIRFLGRVTDHEMIRLYSECRAFVFPGKEDFGIAPLEANASGKAVVAFAAGGALETLTSQTAVFFSEPSSASLEQAVLHLEKNLHKMKPRNMVKNAKRFSEAVFLKKMNAFFASL